MLEEWRAVVGYEGLYEVSNMGQVKALERRVMNNGGLQRKHERILKAHYGQNHHGMVILCKDGKTKPHLVHRLVAMAFIPNPDNKPCIDHIDTDFQNNHVDNLKWCTQKENCNNPLTRQHGSEAKIGHPYWRTKPLSEETREKISKANKGRKFTEEHKEKLRQAHLSKKLSEEQISNSALARTDLHLSEETKAKLRESNKGLHKGQHWKLEGGKRVWY